MNSAIEIEALRKQLPYQKLRQKRGKRIEIDWQAEWERFDARELFDFDISTIPEQYLGAIQKRRDAILDGNHAALSVLTRVVDGLCGYPITPSTPIAEDFAKAAAEGKKNLWG